MRRGRRRDRSQQACRHAERVTTNNSGLEREVCEACGHVSFQHAHESSSDEALALIERQNTNLASLDTPR